MSRRVLLYTGCAVAAIGLSACQSTQDKSKLLEHDGTGSAQQQAISLGGLNKQIETGRPTLLRSGGATAVAVELRNTGATAQAEVPVLIDVRDRRGRSVYRNDVEGLQPALQQMAFLPAGRRAYWVNDQVTAVDKPRDAVVRVGRAGTGAPRGRAPRITLERVRFDRDSTGTYATGFVRNRSTIAQRNVPIYAVALRGGRVVAAGRAIVPRLKPESGGRPTRFRIFFVGDPRGAQLRLTAVPTVLPKAST